MVDLLKDLKKHYDVVLVDAPPLLPVADSIVLSKKVDGVFLVYKVGKVPRNSLRLSKERLEAVSANVMGVVLNDIKPETSGFPHASIYYQYKEHKKKKQAARA
jgi:Mrp family chromosome partitioning ATPase